MTTCEICGVEHGYENSNHKGEDMRVMVTTHPKTGTNLLIQLIGQPEHIRISHNILFMGMDVKSGNEKVAHNEITYNQVYQQVVNFQGTAFGHVPWTFRMEESARAKETLIVQLIRDPRDVIVSHYFHAKRDPEAGFNFIFRDGGRLSGRLDPIGQLIRLAPNSWEKFLPWLEVADAVVRFEELVARPLAVCEWLFREAGGGEAFNVGSPQDMVARIDSKVSPTFRKGQVGDWVNHFTTEHVRDYQKFMGDIHRRLGYGL